MAGLKLLSIFVGEQNMSIISEADIYKFTTQKFQEVI